MKKDLQQLNIGILGGGQLGRMLLQEATNWDLKIAVLDPAHDAPCAHLTHEFAEGDFRDYDTVYNFGITKDIVTIEFEDVNADALSALEEKGVKVYPQPHVLKIIQDKGAQKLFYTENNIPTAPYELIENSAQLQECSIRYPYFQKLRKGGYDGYGVKKITNEVDMGNALPGPSVIEQMADLNTELSVIVARNAKGEIKTFPVVDMEFNPESNMVQFLFAPAKIPAEIENRAIEIAKTIIEKLGMTGLLAVELFYTKQGDVWVNEIAPRPHNSGHHTIEANICSQYEQHLRAICNLSLGDTTTISPAVMLNLLGEKEFSGIPHYHGFDEIMQMKGVYVHLYGKSHTKPFRKMGHVTILDQDLEAAKEKAYRVKNSLKVKVK